MSGGHNSLGENVRGDKIKGDNIYYDNGTDPVQKLGCTFITPISTPNINNE